MLKTISKELDEVLGLRLSALFEMAVFFAALFVIWHIAGVQDRGIHNQLHPFWIIVVLMTVQYGPSVGVLAVVLSTFFLLVGHLPPRLEDENFFDYQFRIYSLPFLWLIAALVIGELVRRKQRRYEDLEKNYELSKIQEKEIARGYEKLRATKESLESRIASQLRSTVSTYQSLQILENTKPAQIFLGLQTLVETIMNPKKFSVYSLGPGGLEASTHVGWEKGDNYLRRFPTDSALYLAIVGEKRSLCVAVREDEKILNREGILAAPLLDRNSGTIFGMLKIEQLDIEELNITNVESFRLICESAGLAYSHAITFQKMSRNSIDDLKYSIPSAKMMVREVNYLDHLAETLHFPLASIHVNLDEGLIGKDQMVQTVQQLDQLSKTIFGPLSRFYVGMGTVFIIIVPLVSRKTLEFSLNLLSKQVEKIAPLNAIHLSTEWYYMPPNERTV